MVRVVADTNIYISALNFGGVPDQILALARRRRIELFISAAIAGEIETVLKRKFEWHPSRIADALVRIGRFSKLVEPLDRVGAVQRDESDNRVLECALTAGAEVIVTGDSHLLELGSYLGIQILNPRAFLETVIV